MKCEGGSYSGLRVKDRTKLPKTQSLVESKAHHKLEITMLFKKRQKVCVVLKQNKNGRQNLCVIFGHSSNKRKYNTRPGAISRLLQSDSLRVLSL